uniref:Uncharacterized protein n=1 Tax=Chrysotila carterae TaxID=13221 RepID=A0A7S4BCR7_CHRCT|mmetsp:Transcript_28618/g.62648  ORF Transcript_28618/g.62648 Transcript_28618/m.62648 type:complete len:175 (+) Transcript_28618:345-869(+)
MIPTQEELLAQWLPSLKAGAVYQKIGRVNAKRAGESGRIETLIDGAHETSNHCSVGDYIVVGPQRERYSLAAHDFSSRYDLLSEQETGDLELRREGFKSFEPTGKVWATQLSAAAVAAHFPDGQLMARWGEPMAVVAGDFIAAPCPAASEVYRIAGACFSASYRRVAESNQACR